MTTTCGIQRVLRGVLASASGAFACALALLIAQLPLLFWVVLYSYSAGIPGAEIGREMVESTGRLPGFLWSFRWALLVVGGVGLPLALVDCLARRIDHPWRGQVSLVALLGLAAGIVITLLYLYQARTIAAALQPGLPLDELISQPPPAIPDPALLMIGLPIALLLTICIHSLWAWWDRRWARWFTREQAQASGGTSPAPQSTVQLRRSLLPAFALTLLICTLGIAAAVQLYHALRAQRDGGLVSITPSADNTTIPITFTSEPERLWLLGSTARGAISVEISQARTQATVATLRERMLPISAPQEFKIKGWSAGEYLLKIQLDNGPGGSISYGFVQAQSHWISLIAALVGLVSGLWATIAGLLILEGLARWVWIEDPRERE
jgi:hypothetical protein